MAMLRRIGRILFSVLLVAAGAVGLVYGLAYRSLPVWATAMVEKTEIVLERPSLPMGPSGPGGRGPSMPLPPPRPKKVTTSVPQDQEQSHRETKVVRDVTVGGIARLADGRLKFTYGPGESGPALCPT